LHLSRLVAEQVIEHRNQTTSFVWNPPSPEYEIQEFFDKTKWSDARLIEPLLFDFYHGLELTLKGFLFLKPGYEPKPEHKLMELFKNFTKVYSTEIELQNIFKKYIEQSNMPDILQQFINENKIHINHMYESLRYPYNKNLKLSFEHLMLQFKGSEGVPFYKDLVKDIETIIKHCKMLRNEIDYNGLDEN